MPVEYTQYLELYVVEQLVCALLVPLHKIPQWSKLALLKPGYLLVICLQSMIGNVTLIQCRHLGHHCLLRLVLCPIQFHLICGSSSGHCCSHRSDELSLFVVMHLALPQVHYMPWSVRSSFWRTSRVMMLGLLLFVMGRNCDPTTVSRGSCLICQVVLLYYGSCLIWSAVFLIQISSAWVWRRGYAAPHCLLVNLAD